MATVRRFGKPDFFVTMTCNPMWREIQENLRPHQKAEDRPDLVTRVFNEKLKKLRHMILQEKFFGTPVAYIDVIEFQKRGLPHAHILIILNKDSKLLSPCDYDRYVSAEVPDKSRYPRAHRCVMSNLIHGPCGSHNSGSPCMKDGECSKDYPKAFADATSHAPDGYPIYRRRNTGPFQIQRGNTVYTVDNSWVVPHNITLCALFDAHINVEICSTIKACKYLYKYVYKGHDRAEVAITGDALEVEVDEIKNYTDVRYIGPCEAMWRIFEFPLTTTTITVVPLQLHLPGANMVTFEEGRPESARPETTLTEFFALCRDHPEARKYTYQEIPEHYTWSKTERRWKMRERGFGKVIGRIHSTTPADQERFFLRLLLLKHRGPTSYEDVRTVDSVTYPSFREAAIAAGLFVDDKEWEYAIEEAVGHASPKSLRLLLATVIAFGRPQNPAALYNRFRDDLLEDLTFRFRDCEDVTATQIEAIGLSQIRASLAELEFDMAVIPDFPQPCLSTDEVTTLLGRLTAPTLSDQPLYAMSLLNPDQRSAFDEVVSAPTSAQKLFFIDGPGGTGKTFLYNTLITECSKNGYTVLSVASSGVAALLLHGGRTAHSVFKIPLDIDESSQCSVSPNSILAAQLRNVHILIWDEAPMTHKHSIEAVDRLLRDLMEVDLPFGGKVVVFGGDFRQTLPVVPRGTPSETVAASLRRSYLWPHIRTLPLKQNMRLQPGQQNSEFAKFLLRVGDGTAPSVDGYINIPQDMFRHLSEFDDYMRKRSEKDSVTL